MEALERLVAESEIRRTILNYSRGVDRRDWELLRSCYHDGAIDNHGPVTLGADDFVEWVRVRHEHIAHSYHLSANIVIDIDDDSRRARAETYSVVFMCTPNGADEPYGGEGEGRTRSTIVVRYVDSLENRPGLGWRFVERTVAYEFVHAAPDHADAGFGPLPPEWVAAVRGPEDVVYAPLPAWRGDGSDA